MVEQHAPGRILLNNVLLYVEWNHVGDVENLFPKHILHRHYSLDRLEEFDLVVVAEVKLDDLTFLFEVSEVSDAANPDIIMVEFVGIGLLEEHLSGLRIPLILVSSATKALNPALVTLVRIIVWKLFRRLSKSRTPRRVSLLQICESIVGRCVLILGSMLRPVMGKVLSLRRSSWSWLKASLPLWECLLFFFSIALLAAHFTSIFS